MEGTDGQTDPGSTERKTNSRGYFKWDGSYRGPCHHQEFVNRSTNRRSAALGTSAGRQQTGTWPTLAASGKSWKQVAGSQLGGWVQIQALRRWRDKQGLTT